MSSSHPSAVAKTNQPKTYRPRHPANQFCIGHWQLCVHSNSLTSGDQRVELEHRLVALLLLFIDHPGEVLTKERILACIWPGKVVNDDSLAVAISHLRKALGDSPRRPRYIKTIPGVGYQFIADAGPLLVADTGTPESALPIPAAHTAHTAAPPAADRPGPAATGRLSIGWPYMGWPHVGGLLGLAVLLFAGLAWWYPNPIPGQPDLEHQAQVHLASGQPEDWRQAIALYKQLLALQPQQASAYLGIARAKLQLLGEQLAQPGHCAEVLGLLDKAIELQPTLADAWLERGNVYFWCRRDLPAAEHNYAQAQQLAPQSDAPPLQLAQLHLAQGRFAESLTAMEQARHLNPLNYSVPMVVWIYQMNRRHDLAWAELQRITQAEPDDRYHHISAQRVLASLGREEESFFHWQWLMADAGFDDDKMAAAQQAFAAEGLAGVNRWLLQTREPADLGQYPPPLAWARYALQAGDYSQAMDLLEQAAAVPQSPLLWLAVDPAYQALHGQARFQALAAQMQQPLQTN